MSSPFRDFLKKENLNRGLADKGLSISSLEEIFTDYEKQISLFEHEATIIKDTISKFEKIHSVKVRVKDKFELIRKIIRKSSKSNPITKNNYLLKITDIIGARIIYLFKSDYLEIHTQIMDVFEEDLAENVQANILTGTENTLPRDIKAIIKENKVYSSIHYIINLNTKPKAKLELQTRTVFEEGVGEISHLMSYKKDNVSPIIQSALGILVRNGDLCNSSAELMKSIYIMLQEPQQDNQDEVVENIQNEIMEHFRKELKK